MTSGRARRLRLQGGHTNLRVGRAGTRHICGKWYAETSGCSREGDHESARKERRSHELREIAPYQLFLAALGEFRPPTSDRG